MICIHHNDLDGKCAAAIVAKAFPGNGLFFHETDYKDSAPKEDNIRNMDIVIVDFSYKPDDMNKIIKAAKSVTWIDHHATAKDYPYQDLPGLRDFKDKSMSGCELTWKYYFPTQSMPLAVQLIGDYDKWALEFQPACFRFYEGMKLEDSSPLSEIWHDLFLNKGWDVIVDSGIAAIKYRDNYCAGLCKSYGYETEIDGHKAYACNQFMFGSKGFGHRFEQYPLCLAYIHDGKQFTVSLYSTTVDVSAIAKKYGGGGHKGAAGFVCDILPWEKKQ
jgi:oligoribonuclease NrnB/cAMP/cGMP phosphodiesterase (DHH superfamily)